MKDLLDHALFLRLVHHPIHDYLMKCSYKPTKKQASRMLRLQRHQPTNLTANGLTAGMESVVEPDKS